MDWSLTFGQGVMNTLGGKSYMGVCGLIHLEEISIIYTVL